MMGATRDRRRRSVFSVNSGGSVRVIGTEVTQAIQNLAHDVRLIAGKRTIARVYVTPQSLPRTIRVRGEITLSSISGGPERYLPSMNHVSLRRSGHPALQKQREDAALSLNFEIPSPAEGTYRVRLNRIIPRAAGDDVPFSRENIAAMVRFEAAPPLRIRVVGLRFTDSRLNPPQNFAPDSLHFDRLRSYLRRTFPVPALDWSQIVVSAGADIKPPFSDGTNDDWLWQRLAAKVLVRLQQIRQADVNAGRDPRTHYYGLITDDRGFFRGRASKVAGQPDPSVVAFGPAGRKGFAWDTDGSYADWYGAHELGHTFGCRHPGFCNQFKDPLSTFPYPNGSISDKTENCIGFDVGDPSLGIPMRALPRVAANDFMTYCNEQWISRHTYDELLDRLRMEDT